MPANEAVALAQVIRKAATDIGACLLETVVQSGAGAAKAQVVIEAADVGRVIEAGRPKILYLLEEVFDLEAEVEAAREALTEIGLAPPAELQAARRRVAARDGEVCAAIGSVVVDGVLHTVIETAEWYEEFEEAIEAITTAAREAAEAGELADRTAASVEIARKAAVLAAHPSFNFGRVSFDKRLTLAEALFAEADHQTLSEITRRAENLFWLQQSGFNRET